MNFSGFRSGNLKKGEGKMDGMIPGGRYETMVLPLIPFAIKMAVFGIRERVIA